MTDNLSPCPFCGSVSATIEVRQRGHWAYCTNDDCGAETLGCTTAEEAIARWNRRAAPKDNVTVDVEAEIARVVQSVNEWDDRTSPDDYPDHLLITSEELSDLLRNFAATLEGSDLA